MKLFSHSLFIFLITSLSLAQSQNTSFSEISQFLNTMETKGLIPLQAYNRFQTEEEMRKILNNIDTSRLTLAEKERMRYLYAKDLVYNKANSFYSNNLLEGLNKYYHGEKVEIFESSDSLFSLKVRPALSIGFKNSYSEMQSSTSFGWSLWGEIGKNIEFRMSFLENGVSAKNYGNLEYNNTPGRIYTLASDGKYEFSETTGSMFFHNSFITIGLTKEKMELGSGIRSQFVLSDKAPSFPSFYMKLSPADWLNIYSMHGWLLSQVPDTVRSYITAVNGKRNLEYEKYFVMHALQLIPATDFSITLGETIMYSDRNIYPGYFIPFLFYRSVDHQFTYGSAESGNNGSFFFEMTGRPIKNVSTFFSVFLDEFSLKGLLKGDNSRNQFGYTFGVKSYPFPTGNIEINAEYTKILPWVYSNWVPTQTYRNAGYILGHYLGQNADQFYLEMLYNPTYKINVKFWGETIRRGGFADVKNQYSPNVSLPFLYGLRMNELSIGLDFSYEMFYNMYVRGSYQYSNITDEDINRTPLWQKGANHAFGMSFSYGL